LNEAANVSVADDEFASVVRRRWPLQISLPNRLLFGLAAVLVSAAAISGFALSTAIRAREMQKPW